ncbi:SH3 domain-containing protein [Lichenicoccus sp.]|uniref:SH3 domain-containing protein n=1 Tax=Lichenicoccus sp. TaxID=2781899 RepID=UPI003D0CB0E7
MRSPACRHMLKAGFAGVALLGFCTVAAAQGTPPHPQHHAHHAQAHRRPTHRIVRHHHNLHGRARPVPPKPAPPPKPLPVPVPLPVPTPPPPADKGTSTGLKLPRFASLRADDVNMRSGPGERYPILWLYHRRGLPVEILREFDVWRLVVDADGVKGWVHQATLVGTRTFVVTASGPARAGLAASGNGTLLLDDPQAGAAIVAILRPGVVGRLRDCPSGSGWCRVVTHAYSGWLRRSAIFGLLPGEAIAPP